MLKTFHESEESVLSALVMAMMRQSRLAELRASVPALRLLPIMQSGNWTFELLPLCDPVAAHECDILPEGELLDHPHSGPVWAPEKLLQAFGENKGVDTVANRLRFGCESYG
jgi:hypothetical protein